MCALNAVLMVDVGHIWLPLFSRVSPDKLTPQLVRQQVDRFGTSLSGIPKGLLDQLKIALGLLTLNLALVDVL